jgi:hypothetical protein
MASGGEERCPDQNACDVPATSGESLACGERGLTQADISFVWL